MQGPGERRRPRHPRPLRPGPMGPAWEPRQPSWNCQPRGRAEQSNSGHSSVPGCRGLRLRTGRHGGGTSRRSRPPASQANFRGCRRRPRLGLLDVEVAAFVPILCRDNRVVPCADVGNRRAALSVKLAPRPAVMQVGHRVMVSNPCPCADNGRAVDRFSRLIRLTDEPSAKVQRNPARPSGPAWIAGWRLVGFYSQASRPLPRTAQAAGVSIGSPVNWAIIIPSSIEQEC